MDVMNPPRVSRTDQIVNYNIRLETLLERSLEREQLYQEQLHDDIETIDTLQSALLNQEEVIHSLRKEVKELTKPRKLPKRQASNYMKPRNRGT